MNIPWTPPKEIGNPFPSNPPEPHQPDTMTLWYREELAKLVTKLGDLESKLKTALDQFADLRKLYAEKCEECERLKRKMADMVAKLDLVIDFIDS